MSDSAEGFAELLARVRAGDQVATARLIELYEPQVRAVARARLSVVLRTYLDSVDLLQSVHRTLIVGLRAEKFDISSPDKLIGLAVTIVQRKVARQWRRAKRQSRDSQATSASEQLAERLLSLSRSEPDPATAVELREQVRQLIETLDETDRKLIELRLEGQSTAEAARTLGLDADVLRVRLSRLRKRLRESKLIRDL
jgi:RNA polymerase sigma-70 factor (ECF subfamily)